MGWSDCAVGVLAGWMVLSLIATVFLAIPLLLTGPFVIAGAMVSGPGLPICASYGLLISVLGAVIVHFACRKATSEYMPVLLSAIVGAALAGTWAEVTLPRLGHPQLRGAMLLLVILSAGASSAAGRHLAGRNRSRRAAVR